MPKGFVNFDFFDALFGNYVYLRKEQNLYLLAKTLELRRFLWKLFASIKAGLF